MTDPGSPLAAALAAAQAAMKNAPLNKTNPHFRKKYADLAAIRDATIPALAANGLAITQTTAIRDGMIILRTRLAHSSGETIESEYPIPIDKPQIMGSAITYGRRYCWAAMCGIAAEDDDDANAAQEGKTPAGSMQTFAADPRDDGALARAAYRAAEAAKPAPAAFRVDADDPKITELKHAVRALIDEIRACANDDDLGGVMDGQVRYRWKDEYKLVPTARIIAGCEKFGDRMADWKQAIDDAAKAVGHENPDAETDGPPDPA